MFPPEDAMDSKLIDETVSLTRELVRLRSENPGGTEADMMERTEAFLRGLGLDVQRDEVIDGRQNITAELSASSTAPALVFLNHMDTVPAGEGWTRDPFSAEVSGGKLWGRGACDMKGGLAAALIAVKSLKARLDRGAKLRRPIRTCLVVDEECQWMQGVSKAVDIGRITKEDVVISCEPTGLELKTAQKGAMWFELLFSGRSAHAATPQLGANAIQAAARTLVQLEELATSMDTTHDLLGKTTIVTSVIRGGSKINIVPDSCRIEVDVRFIPPLSIPEVSAFLLDAAEEACKDVPGASATLRTLSVDRPPVLSDLRGSGGKIISEAIAGITGAPPRPAGVSYYTDAGLAAARTGNSQCFLLGPGNIGQAHGPDEYVEVEELRMSAVILAGITEKYALT